MESIGTGTCLSGLGIYVVLGFGFLVVGLWYRSAGLVWDFGSDYGFGFRFPFSDSGFGIRRIGILGFGVRMLQVLGGSVDLLLTVRFTGRLVS